MSGKIYWIDDKEGTFPTGALKDQLEEACDAGIEPFIANHSTLDDVRGKLEQGADVKMIVLDYWLANLPREADSSNGGKTEFGSAWAAALRADRPELPIVGVTSESLGDIPDSQKSQFLQLMDRRKIFDLKHNNDLRALLDSFSIVYSLWSAALDHVASEAKLPRRQDISISTIEGLLRPPKSTAGYLATALPEFVKQPWDQETPHEFSRWIIEVLLCRPGFLADDLELATMLGLTPLGFEKVAEKFSDALYDGVYASNDRPRWWVDSIRPIFYTIIGYELSGPMRHHRDKLLGALSINVEPSFLSRAYPDDDLSKIPDCVAYSDDQRLLEDRIQARCEDTVTDPLESPPTGFEARRLWKPAETERVI
jgi:hypothetical protein